MGFWDTFTSTLGDVANTVVNHAGDIATAVGVVSKIAGAVAFEEDVANNGGNQLPSLYGNLVTNEAKLVQDAQKSKPAAASDIAPFYNMTGLWPQPPDTSDGNAPSSVSSDFAKFLTINKLPTTIGDAQNTLDLGQELQNACFANTTPASKSDANGTNSNSIQRVGINIDGLNGEKIVGHHSYYLIPLGNKNGNNAMHSCTRIQYVAPKSVSDARAASERQLALNPGSISTTSNGPYSTTTVDVKWPGAVGVQTLMQQAIHNFTQGPTYKLTGIPVNDGTKFTYQVKTDLSTTPGMVKSSLSKAIQGTLTPTTSLSDGSPGPSNMPMVTVTNVATML